MIAISLFILIIFGLIVVAFGVIVCALGMLTLMHRCWYEWIDNKLDHAPDEEDK